MKGLPQLEWLHYMIHLIYCMPPVKQLAGSYISHYFSMIFERVAYHLNPFIKSVIYSPWCPAQLMSAMM